MKKRVLLCSVVVLFSLLFLAGTVVAQGSAAKKEVQKVTMKGKIMERSGGYYLMGENPPSEVFIINQNKRVLDKLKTSGEMVTIEGHFTIGADHLMIEKINGKKY